MALRDKHPSEDAVVEDVRSIRPTMAATRDTRDVHGASLNTGPESPMDIILRVIS